MNKIKMLSLLAAAAMMTGSVAMAETYSATGNGYHGEMTVDVTIENGTITDCQVVYEHETKGLGDLAVEEMPKRIIEAGSPNVDMVASATMASAAIRVAAMDALSQLGY